MGPGFRRDNFRLRHCGAHNVSGWGIAADEEVPFPGAVEGAADARGRAPDHLGVMTDVGPMAAGADVREPTGAEQAALLGPASGHVLEAVGVAAPHPEILPL